MAIVDDDVDGGYGPAPRSGRAQWLVNVAGAVTSAALVLGVTVWGYKLAVRDVSGIPVVRAMDGPMRIAPQNPGGEIAANVGLSVNQVAAAGAAAPLPDQLVLAPRPVDLSQDDQPVIAAAPLAGTPEVTTLASLPAEPLPEPIVPVVPVGELTETVLAEPAALTPEAMEAAVDNALAEALGGAVDETQVLASAEPAPPGAVVRSPRPERRPEGDSTADAGLVPVSASATAAATASSEVDVASLALGTRLVQLGAFDDEAGARAEWAKLQVRFGDLIAPKALVLQQADSGGRSFVRLRALGFEDEADARRFCSALLAENASCIPVAHRP